MAEARRHAAAVAGMQSRVRRGGSTQPAAGGVLSALQRTRCSRMYAMILCSPSPGLLASDRMTWGREMVETRAYLSKIIYACAYRNSSAAPAHTPRLAG